MLLGLCSVEVLGHHMSTMNDDPTYSHNIYKYFIYQHLWHRNESGGQTADFSCKLGFFIVLHIVNK